MVAQGNVGLAFGLVAASGLATCLGACIVWCTNLAQPRLLAGSLGFAAGVMLFVSFGEIFMRKSIAAFQGGVENTSADVAFRWATLCFFGGMLIIAILDKLVHVLVNASDRRSKRRTVAGSVSTANLLACEDKGPPRGHGRHKQQRHQASDSATSPPQVLSMSKQQDGEVGQGAAAAAGRGGGAASNAAAAGAAAGSRDVESGGLAADAAAAAAEVCISGVRARSSLASDDGSGSMSMQQGALSAPGILPEPCDSVTGAVVAATSPDVLQEEQQGGHGGMADPGDPAAVTTTSRTPPAVVEIMEADHHTFMLKKMGLLTALAIFIHNFPEGLATFVGALADTKVGVGLAVAIAMHNIPEGICVAMPIYYATGSRWKGFMWALLSGLSEPLGALVGYLILDGDSTSLSFAIVFGLVAGMMVYISVKELIPTALRYDPKDSVATTCVILGMIVMAASLLLFTI